MADDLDPDAPEPEPQDNAVIRELREQAKAGKAAEARAEAAERKLAFVGAGIDPDDARQKYFAQSYAGEMTKDAIRTEAEAAGFLTPPATSAPEGLTPAERATFAATAEAAAAPYTPPPETDIYADFRGQSLRTTGEPPEQFGHRLANALEAAGQPVLRSGPFREYPGDTGIVPRPGTPTASQRRL